MVVTVKYEMNVPKEGKEIADFISKLTELLVEGKISEAGKLINDGIQAVDNFKGVMAEIKSNYKDELAAYMMHKMWEALDKGQDVVPA